MASGPPPFCNTGAISLLLPTTEGPLSSNKWPGRCQSQMDRLEQADPGWDVSQAVWGGCVSCPACTRDVEEEPLALLDGLQRTFCPICLGAFWSRYWLVEGEEDGARSLMADALCPGSPGQQLWLSNALGTLCCCLCRPAEVGRRRSGGEQDVHQGSAVVSWCESSLWSNMVLGVGAFQSQAICLQ